MRPGDIVRLFLLAAIWGSSFIFIRIVAPPFGAILSADLRVIIAGVALLGYCRLVGIEVGWRAHWKQYLLIGTLNTAIPFSLYSFAGLHIPAAYSVILNSTAPLFGAIFAAVWLAEKVTLAKALGLVVGFAGVATVAQGGRNADDPMAAWGILACIAASSCYGLAGVYLRKFARHLKPQAMASACQIMAGLVLSPSLFLLPSVTVTGTELVCLLALALLCSGIAYLLYYRLMQDVGPTKTLTVTFLMPAFGMLWGWLFLSEQITPRMLAGCGLILLGTLLVVRPPVNKCQP